MRVHAGPIFGAMFLLVPVGALAGDDVLYGETPDWVSEARLTATEVEDGPPELLADWQHRIEDGVVHSYWDRAVRIDNPRALMQENTLNVSWLPDKGDLTIHRLEILRDGAVIDLAEDGDTGSALALLAEEVDDKPQNSEVLNADCWFRGLFNVALDSAMSQCTRAVERADNAVAALDSRAMVRYRLGEYDAAIADLNAALALAPALAPSRYLRGVVRLRNGDPAGREDIETALRMAPELADIYGRHGVKPAS